MSWTLFVNTMVTAGIGGVNKTNLSPMQASVLFERVSPLSFASLLELVELNHVQCLWIEGFPLRIGLATIKTSVLLFYRRIFITKNFRRCVDFTNAVIIAWCISMVLVSNLMTPSQPTSEYSG